MGHQLFGAHTFEASAQSFAHVLDSNELQIWLRFFFFNLMRIFTFLMSFLLKKINIKELKKKNVKRQEEKEKVMICYGWGGTKRSNDEHFFSFHLDGGKFGIKRN